MNFTMLQIIHVKLVECTGSLIDGTFGGVFPPLLKGNAPKRQVLDERSLLGVKLHFVAPLANQSEVKRIDSPHECSSTIRCQFLMDMAVAQEDPKIVNIADLLHVIWNFSSHLEVSSSSSSRVCFCKLIINFRENLLK